MLVPRRATISGRALSWRQMVTTSLSRRGMISGSLLYDKDTKGAADVKVGAKVTVYYVMKATSIEVKSEPKKAEPKAAPKKK